MITSKLEVACGPSPFFSVSAFPDVPAGTVLSAEVNGPWDFVPLPVALLTVKVARLTHLLDPPQPVPTIRTVSEMRPPPRIVFQRTDIETVRTASQVQPQADRLRR